MAFTILDNNLNQVLQGGEMQSAFTSRIEGISNYGGFDTSPTSSVDPNIITAGGNPSAPQGPSGGGNQPPPLPRNFSPTTTVPYHGKKRKKDRGMFSSATGDGSSLILPLVLAGGVGGAIGHWVLPNFGVKRNTYYTIGLAALGIVATYLYLKNKKSSGFIDGSTIQTLGVNPQEMQAAANASVSRANVVPPSSKVVPPSVVPPSATSNAAGVGTPKQRVR